MMQPDSVEKQMIQRSARLVSGTRREEAWHLFSLFQQAHPDVVLHICHRAMAAYLVLNHDHFEKGWPLVTRIVRPIESGRIRRNRVATTSADLMQADMDDVRTECDWYACASSPYRRYRRQERDVVPQSSPCALSHSHTAVGSKPTVGQQEKNNWKRSSGGRLRSISAKRLLKHILPSKPCVPITYPTTPLRVTASNANKVSTVDLPVAARLPPIPATTKPGSYKLDDRSLDHTVHCMFNNSVSLGLHHHQYKSMYSQHGGLGPLLTGCYSSLDSLIAHCLIDYMFNSPAVCATPGLFRVPGNSTRIRELWRRLRSHFQAPYYRVPQPEPENCPPNPWDCEDCQLHSLLQGYNPHDLASLLLRSISTCTQTVTSQNKPTFSRGACMEPIEGLIPAQAGELCFLATRLQYALHWDGDCDTWMHILCEARQLFTYRIVIQLLLPSPERYLLLQLLRLFKRVSNCEHLSKMSDENIARCAAVAIFGAPFKRQEWAEHQMVNSINLSLSVAENNPLQWSIDTLTNLIRLSDQLDVLPGIIYSAVRDRVRSRFGKSPATPQRRIQQTMLIGSGDEIDEHDHLETVFDHQTYSKFSSKAGRNGDMENFADEFISQSQPMPHCLLPIDDRTTRLNRNDRIRSSITRAVSLTPLHAAQAIRYSDAVDKETFTDWPRQRPSTKHQVFVTHTLTKSRSFSVFELDSIEYADN